MHLAQYVEEIRYDNFRQFKPYTGDNFGCTDHNMLDCRGALPGRRRDTIIGDYLGLHYLVKCESMRRNFFRFISINYLKVPLSPVLKHKLTATYSVFIPQSYFCEVILENDTMIRSLNE